MLRGSLLSLLFGTNISQACIVMYNGGLLFIINSFFDSTYNNIKISSMDNTRQVHEDTNYIEPVRDGNIAK